MSYICQIFTHYIVITGLSQKKINKIYNGDDSMQNTYTNVFISLYVLVFFLIIATNMSFWLLYMRLIKVDLTFDRIKSSYPKMIKFICFIGIVFSFKVARIYSSRLSHNDQYSIRFEN